MKIYLDYIFFENFLVNLIITFYINYFTNKTYFKNNIIIGNIFLSLYTTLLYIFDNTFLNLIIVKIVITLIYSYIVFKPKTIIELLKNTIYYYLFLFMYIGIIISITLFFNISLEKHIIKTLIYILSSCILFIFSKDLWKIWKSNLKNNDLVYTLNLLGEEIKAFIDTGHNVKDLVTNLDVIFIDVKFKDKLEKKIDKNKKILININTLNKKSLEEGYIIEDVCFYKNKHEIGKIKKVIICFISSEILSKKYSALIGYDIYVHILKGVTFC